MKDFVDNAAKNRFEYRIGDAVVFADYRRDDDRLYIDHVEAPPELRGSGAAGRLMEYIVTVADDEKRGIVPVCGYAAAWISRHA